MRLDEVPGLAEVAVAQTVSAFAVGFVFVVAFLLDDQVLDEVVVLELREVAVAPGRLGAPRGGIFLNRPLLGGAGE